MKLPVGCDVYEALELACLRRQWLVVSTGHRQTIEGRAQTIETQAEREFLVLELASGDCRVSLLEIESVSAQSGDLITQILP